MFTPTVLGSKEAEMRIIGCDLHARQQTLAMLDTATGEVVNKTLTHEGENVREFYSTLPGPVRRSMEKCFSPSRSAVLLAACWLCAPLASS